MADMRNLWHQLDTCAIGRIPSSNTFEVIVHSFFFGGGEPLAGEIYSNGPMNYYLLPTNSLLHHLSSTPLPTTDGIEEGTMWSSEIHRVRMARRRVDV